MGRVNGWNPWTTNLDGSIVISRGQKVWRDVPNTVYWCTFPYSVLLRCGLIFGHPLMDGQSSIGDLYGPGVDRTAFATKSTLGTG